MTYDLGESQRFSDHEHWATLGAGQHPWEYALRFVERDLHEKGWDGYPQILLVQVTEGNEGGMLTMTQIMVPEESFRANPLTFMGIFLDELRKNGDVRKFYSEHIGDSRIAGLLLAFEGWGVKSESAGDIEKIRAEVNAGTGRLADHPASVEQRVLTGIPSGELKFYALIRQRGEEPEFNETSNKEDVARIMMGSRTHMVGVDLLLEFQKMQTEAATA